MTEDRPYRRARPRFEVDHEFRDCSGSQFDPYVVEALREVVSYVCRRDKLTGLADSWPGSSPAMVGSTDQARWP